MDWERKFNRQEKLAMIGEPGAVVVYRKLPDGRLQCGRCLETIPDVVGAGQFCSYCAAQLIWEVPRDDFAAYEIIWPQCEDPENARCALREFLWIADGRLLVAHFSEDPTWRVGRCEKGCCFGILCSAHRDQQVLCKKGLHLAPAWNG